MSDIADNAPTQFDQYADREEVSLVLDDVERLPVLLREAFVWRIFEDCSYREIASRQGVTQALARKRVQLARDRLRGDHAMGGRLHSQA